MSSVGAEETKDEHGFPRVEFPGLTSARFKEIENKVLADCRAKIDPEIVPIVDELPGSAPGQRVLVFIVPASGSAHCYRASGKDASTYYVRVSRETIEARNGVLRELLVRKGAQEPSGSRPNPHATLADIDLLAFREVLQQTGNWNPSMGVDDYFDEKMRLSALVPSLGARRMLDREIRPRNFALILFGREPTRFFSGGLHQGFVPSRQGPTANPPPNAKKFSARWWNRPRSPSTCSEPIRPPLLTRNPPCPMRLNIPRAHCRKRWSMLSPTATDQLDTPTNITIFANRIEIRSPGGLPRTVDPGGLSPAPPSPSWRNQRSPGSSTNSSSAKSEGQGIPQPSSAP